MKTLIIYISKHGTTEKVAREIAKKLKVKEKDIVNLRKERNPDINGHERIIIGGSIHAGMVQKRIKDFCGKNMDTLLDKEVGLFLSAMDKNRYKEEFNNAFPEKLRNHSKAKAVTGGEFNFEKMNFLEKAIVKKVGNVEESVSDINYSEIERFVKEFSI
ncbi:MAG: flavodoxin domain-containing protein [Bacteroidota bacterium]